MFKQELMYNPNSISGQNYVLHSLPWAEQVLPNRWSDRDTLM